MIHSKKYIIKSGMKTTLSLYVRMALLSMPIQVFFVQVIVKISAMYIIYFFSIVMTNVPSFEVQTI